MQEAREECKVEGCEECMSADKRAISLGVCDKHLNQILRLLSLSPTIVNMLLRR